MTSLRKLHKASDREQKRRESALAKIELARRRGKADLYYFAREVLGYKKMVPHVHEKLCRFLMHEIPHGAGEQTTKVILMPRGSFKSTVGTMAYALWRLINDPDITILLTNETLDKSKAFLAEIKNHITGNKMFRTLYGEMGPIKELRRQQRWSSTHIDVACKTKWGKEPSIEASSVSGTETGKHFDLIICDDLVGQSNYMGADLEHAKQYVRDLGAVLKPGGMVQHIGTRWDYRDVFQDLLDFIKEMGDLSRAEVMVEKARRDDGSLLFPEELSDQFLKAQRIKLKTYFFSCTPSETPILMSDWSTKRIEDVEVGDEVIGYTIGNAEHNAHLKPAKVTEINSRIADVYTYTLKSGRKVRCTKDHQWYSGRTGADGYHHPYRPMDVGDRLCFVADVFDEPTPEDVADYRYLAGIIDGEGACKHNNCIYIHQCPIHNPEVHAEIRACLDRLGIDYGKSKDGTAVWIRGGLAAKEKIVRFGRPAKACQLLVKMNDAAKFIRERDEIVDIKYDGKERVHALVTETGNYVAWGYASKNCQYQNEPVAQEDMLVSPDDILKYNDRLKGQRIDEFWKLCRFFCTVDLAYTDNDTSDSTAIVVNGMLGSSPDWHIKEAFKFKSTKPSKVIEEIFRIHKAYRSNGHPVVFGIEDNNYKQWLRIPLETEMRKRNVFPNIKPLPHYGKQGNKAARLRNLEPRFKQHACYLHAQMTELEDELLTLTYDGARGHDDLLDALAMQDEVAAWGLGEPRTKDENTEAEMERGESKRETFGERKRRAMAYMREQRPSHCEWLGA